LVLGNLGVTQNSTALAPTAATGGGLAVAEGTEIPEGSFFYISVNLLFAASLPAGGGCERVSAIVRHVALKSASPQIFLLCRNANLSFQKHNCAICTVKFLTQLLIATFITGFGMVNHS
jgi:hypothetical protein